MRWIREEKEIILKTQDKSVNISFFSHDVCWVKWGRLKSVMHISTQKHEILGAHFYDLTADSHTQSLVLRGKLQNIALPLCLGHL